MILPHYSQIEPKHIQGLIDAKVSEQRTLDYKRDLPGTREEDVQEFARDVSSFANADGGHILFGIEEAKDEAGKNLGYAGRIVGVGGATPDQAIQRMEHFVGAHIEPNLVVHFRAVEVAAGVVVVVLQIPASLNAPHAVKKRMNFWIRGSSRKDLMDPVQLRAAFVGSEALIERVRIFHAQRFKRGSRSGHSGRIVFLQVISLSQFRSGLTLPVAKLVSAQGGLRTLSDSPATYRITLEGVEGVYTYGDVRTTIHLRKDGVVEIADEEVGNFEGDAIHGPALEVSIKQFVERALDVLKGTGAEPPFLLALSLRLGPDTKLVWGSDRRQLARNRSTFDRSTVVLPDLLLDDFPADVGRALRPIFDSMYNAAGHAKSVSFDAAGDFTAT
jgi:hypothetical protein